MNTFSPRCERCAAPLSVSLPPLPSRVLTTGFVVLFIASLALMTVPVNGLFYPSLIFLPLFVWIGVGIHLQRVYGSLQPAQLAWWRR